MGTSQKEGTEIFRGNDADDSLLSSLSDECRMNVNEDPGEGITRLPGKNTSAKTAAQNEKRCCHSQNRPPGGAITRQSAAASVERAWNSWIEQNQNEPAQNTDKSLKRARQDTHESSQTGKPSITTLNRSGATLDECKNNSSLVSRIRH